MCLEDCLKIKTNNYQVETMLRNQLNSNIIQEFNKKKLKDDKALIEEKNKKYFLVRIFLK